MLISICGIDGSGKTTQVNLLKKHLNRVNDKVIICKQHTETYYDNERYKKYLQGALDKTKLTDYEMILYASYDRMKQYQLGILPYLEKNYIVITDRYVFSTYAYAKTRGVDLLWTMEMNKHLPLPDFTFILDINPLEASKRTCKRDSRTIEESSLDFDGSITVSDEN